MSDFANVLTTGPEPHKATAGVATGAIVLAILATLVVAQVIIAIQNPEALGAASQLAPFGIVAP
jgi:hypothetical protein